MDKAKQVFSKVAQTQGSKLYWYGPSHPKASTIRSEFAQLGRPLSNKFPVATDTTSTGVTLMGYRGRGFTADVVKKTPKRTALDSLSIGKASDYLYSVANKRGYSLHNMGAFTSNE